MSNPSSGVSLEALAAGPVHLLPRFVERIWGTKKLDPYFPPSDKQIGEVWLTAEECVVAGTSVTLGELTGRLPGLLGNTDGTGFPLLLKLLFPREKLSIQVHPNDAQAQATLGQPRGKTECWYVLSADPGAVVAVGFREPLTREAMQQAVVDGTIESKLRMLPVQAGDMVFVDAGTVHAIGPGVVLLETQQYSDVTYRLWDYGRDRELHVEAGLAVTRTSTNAGPVPPIPMGAFDRLVTCPYFTVDRFRLQPGDEAKLGVDEQLQILVAIGEGAVLRSQAANGWRLPQAHAVLLTPGAGPRTLQAASQIEVIRILQQLTAA